MSDIASDQTNPVSPAPVASNKAGSFLKRELSGATFLTLEHAGHMALVVVVAVLMAAGINAGVSMWTPSNVHWASDSLASLGSSYIMASMAHMWAIGLVAALVVLVPLLVMLDRRTRAEWPKRPGYSGRLAYKLPIYTALSLLVALKIGAFISMLAVVLQSLVSIGVAGTDIGQLYVGQFVPAAIAWVVFSAYTWYLFKLAKGRDLGKAYSTLTAVAGIALTVALFTTAAVQMRSSAGPIQTLPAPAPDYSDMMRDYNPGDKNFDNLFKY